MADEHEQMLRALETAIELEMDSKECYLGAAEATENTFAKELLRSFAEEEDIHRQQFTQIYNAVRSNGKWPAIDLNSGSGDKHRELLGRTCQAIGIGAEADATPIHLIDAAIDKEDRNYNFYKEKAGQATFESERSFYKSLALEERDHYLILIDYKEFLEDPAGWFTKTERWSEDGA